MITRRDCLAGFGVMLAAPALAQLSKRRRMKYRSYTDIGGELGHGPVVSETDEPAFQAEWERQVLGLVFGIGATGQFNGDRLRSAFETIPNYPALSYYHRWLRGLEILLVEDGVVGTDELSAGRMLHPARAVPVLRAADVPSLFESQVSTQRPATAPARFAVGDGVRTRVTEVNHHTRLPGYARGRFGHIEQVHGVHVFPDTHAHGLGEQPKWVYTVVFTGRELWGDSAAKHLTVSIDAWEPYLEHVA